VTPPAAEFHETAETLSTPLSTGAKKSKGRQSPKRKGASPNVEAEHHEFSSEITPTTLEFGDVDVSEGEVVDNKSGNVEVEQSSDMEIEMPPPSSKPSKKAPKKTQNQATSSSPTKKGEQTAKKKSPKEKKEKKRKPKEAQEDAEEQAKRKRFKPVPYWENKIVNYTPDAKRRCTKDDEFL